MATSATVERYVQGMVQAFRADRAGRLRAVYHLRLTGAGSWTVSVADGKCAASAGETARPDTTITMSGDNYLKLAAGQLNVRDAYQRGEIGVGGSLEYALKFTEIFPPWSAAVEEQQQEQPAVPPDQPASKPPPTAPTGPAPTPAVADYVRAMPSGLRADRAGGLRVAYEFVLSGADGGNWTVVIADGKCTVNEAQADSPTVSIRMSGADYIQLARGQLNTTQAFQQGRIQIQGDVNLAAKIPDIFNAWAGAVETTTPSEPGAGPEEGPGDGPDEGPVDGPVNQGLQNGSFDDYQPYVRDGEAKVWKEPQFPEQYGAHWQLKLVSEGDGRLHLMDSGTFGRFTQKYFGGGGRDYHIHGKHSQVVTSRYDFDLIFMQTVAAQPGRDYRFSGAIVSFYKGTSGERADGKIFKTLGVDPTGGQAHDSPNVVWSERDGKDNEWRYPALQVKAQGDAITVFIRLENVEEDVGATELNIVHLENFKLE